MRVTKSPNKKLVEKIEKALEKNDGYCPCKLTKNPDTKCICKEFRDLIDKGENAVCHCGLYVILED